MLNNNWYSGKQVCSWANNYCRFLMVCAQYQKYAFEYVPGQKDGQIAWFVGDEETFRMTGKRSGEKTDKRLTIGRQFHWAKWKHWTTRRLKGTNVNSSKLGVERVVDLDRLGEN